MTIEEELQSVTKVFEELVKNKIVKREGTWYNIYKGEEKSPLAQAKKDAILILKERVDSGELDLKELWESKPDPLPSKAKGSNVNQSPSKTPKNFAPSGESKYAGVDYKEAMSKLDDVQSFDKAKALTIYIHGVKSTLKDEPAVKECPFHFRWMNKGDMVEDGGGQFTVKGYRVANKQDFIIKSGKRKGKRWLTTERDDSPKESFFTIGNLVLCYTNKREFEKKKLSESLKGTLNVEATAQQRNQFAVQQSLADPSDQMQGYNALNANDRKIMPTEVDIDKLIEESGSIEEATEKMSKLVNDTPITEESDTIPKSVNANDF